MNSTRQEHVPSPGPGVSVRVSGPVSPPVIEQLCSGQIHGAPRTRSGSFDNFLREKVRTERKARCAAPALCCGSAGPNRLDLCSEVSVCPVPAGFALTFELGSDRMGVESPPYSFGVRTLFSFCVRALMVSRCSSFLTDLQPRLWSGTFHVWNLRKSCWS